MFHAYETCGISKDVGARFVVRPDQHVALFCGLEETELLDLYFAAFMIPAKEAFPGSLVTTIAPPNWETVENQAVSDSKAVSEGIVAPRLG